MTQVNSTPPASYELPLPVGDLAPLDGPGNVPSSLPESMLLRNVTWFCRIRWIVVVALLLFGLVAFYPRFGQALGLRFRIQWPIVCAVVLAAANLGFLAHARSLAKPESAPGARANLWAQIVLDLTVLTVVVHYIGSLETYIAFAYLFHIVLACIFFSRGQSFGVAALACAFYLACTALEMAGLLPSTGLYPDSPLRKQIESTPGIVVLNVGSAPMIWLVVWYLASHLAAMVRERDRELDETNRRLLEAQQEKSRHMLLTAHEMKAPFAAIHANVQLLLQGHCGPLSERAVETLERIAARCRRLAAQIQDMLQLANLQSPSEKPLRLAKLDLAETLRWALAQVQPLAEERAVEVESELQPAQTLGVEDHMKMMFTNLLANAVNYSVRGGKVHVRCLSEHGDGCIVTIEDHGIGIQAEKLPRIFEEYYRTAEAVRHNKESTGLGLAIVRRVAETHGIQIRVESEPGVGTKFTLRLTSPAGA